MSHNSQPPVQVSATSLLSWYTYCACFFLGEICYYGGVIRAQIQKFISGYKLKVPRLRVPSLLTISNFSSSEGAQLLLSEHRFKSAQLMEVNFERGTSITAPTTPV